MDLSRTFFCNCIRQAAFDFVVFAGKTATETKGLKKICQVAVNVFGLLGAFYDVSRFNPLCKQLKDFCQLTQASKIIDPIKMWLCSEGAESSEQDLLTISNKAFEICRDICAFLKLLEDIEVISPMRFLPLSLIKLVCDVINSSFALYEENFKIQNEVKKIRTYFQDEKEWEHQQKLLKKAIQNRDEDAQQQLVAIYRSKVEFVQKELFKQLQALSVNEDGIQAQLQQLFQSILENSDQLIKKIIDLKNPADLAHVDNEHEETRGALQLFQEVLQGLSGPENLSIQKTYEELIQATDEVLRDAASHTKAFKHYHRGSWLKNPLKLLEKNTEFLLSEGAYKEKLRTNQKKKSALIREIALGVVSVAIRIGKIALGILGIVSILGIGEPYLKRFLLVTSLATSLIVYLRYLYIKNRKELDCEQCA